MPNQAALVNCRAAFKLHRLMARSNGCIYVCVQLSNFFAEFKSECLMTRGSVVYPNSDSIPTKRTAPPATKGFAKLVPLLLDQPKLGIGRCSSDPDATMSTFDRPSGMGPRLLKVAIRS